MTSALSLGLTLVALAATLEDPGEVAYLRALDHVAAREFDAASDALAQVVELHPDSPYAPAALLEWAALAARAGDEAVALARLERLLADYPTHRLARTAAGRAEALRQRAGRDEVERVYHTILEGYAAQGADASMARMEALLADHAEHPVAADALCWLAAQHRQQGDQVEAFTRYEQALARDADADCALRGLQYIAVLSMEHRELGRAADAIARMGSLGDAGVDAQAHHATTLRMVRVRVWTARILIGGAPLALIGVLAGLPLRRVRRDELTRGLLPAAGVIAGLFLVGSLVGGGLRTLLAVVALVLGALVWLHGVARGLPRPAWHRRVYPAAMAWLAAAGIYAALHLLDRV